LVHGCYWHRHEGCRFAYNPKSRIAFWTKKFEENVKRDQKNMAALEGLGWKVVVIWECELRNIHSLKEKIINLFSTK